MLRREFLKRCFGTVAALFVVKKVASVPEPIKEILDWKIDRRSVTMTCTKPYPPGFHEVPIEYIKVDPTFNVRDRSCHEHNVRQLSKSILMNGLYNPIVIKGDGTLIDGHFRLDAMKQLGWTKVPVQVYNLTPYQAKVVQYAMMNQHRVFNI